MNEKGEEKDGKKLTKTDAKTPRGSNGKTSEKAQNASDSSPTGSLSVAGRSVATSKQMTLTSSGSGRKSVTERVSKSPDKSEFRLASRSAGLKDGASRSKGRDGGSGSRPPRRDAGRSHHSSTQVSKAGSSSASSPRGTVDSRKLSDHGRPFSDDSRLSKLIKRVTRDGDRRLTSAKQLREFLLTEGTKALSKPSDDILTSLQDVFYERCGKDLKQEVAMCIGAVGFLMINDSQRYFQWLFSAVNNSTVDEDTKTLYLQALLETLLCDEKKQSLKDFLPSVMSNIQTVLENADSPETLTAVVDIILYISKQYPHVFNSHFRDTVDILVGWHIDSTQKDALTGFTSQALIDFHQYWISDLAFSVTLLGQFLEDMEAYAEDLSLTVSGQSVVDDELPSSEECITKIGSLLRVFTTVVEALGDSFSPTHSQQVTVQYITEVLERIVRCVEGSTLCLYSDKVLQAANHCLLILITQLQSHLTTSNETILPYIINQVCSTKSYSTSFLIPLLKLTQMVIEAVNTQLPVNFCSQLLGPGSCFLQLRLSNNTEVLSQLMSVYHSIMRLKSVPLLEEAYRLVVGDLQTAYNSLLEHAGAEYRCQAVTNNTFLDTQYNTRLAKLVFIFNITVLTEIGNAKNNLIGMWALSPSVFNLFKDHLKPTLQPLAEWFPALQYSILYALYSHCVRHGNFVSTSALLTQCTEGSVMSNVSPTTSENFSSVLPLLADLLKQPYHSYDTICLGLKWTGDVIENLQSSSHVFRSTEFLQVTQGLITLGYDKEYQLCMAAANCLKILLQFNSLSEELLNRCLEVCLMRICDSIEDIREIFMELLKLIPINITTRLSGMTKTQESSEGEATLCSKRDLKASWLARRNHINTVPLGTFHTHNFKQVIGYILNISAPSSDTTSSGNWLEDLYFASQRSDKSDDKKEECVKLSNLIEGHNGLLWYWATWEAAQFCVLARLRTSLGKPQDTFMSIEAGIKKYAVEIQKQAELDDTAKKTNNVKTDRDSVFKDRQRVTLLLQFLEQLEKLLYNAYEGCATAMPNTPKMVRTFFRTNRGTCQEWLSRIRTGVITVALHAGKPALVVRHSYALLKEMKESGNTQGPEFEHILMCLVQALCKLGSSDCLQGLYCWCKDVIGRKLLWLKAAAEKADSRFELAITSYNSVLKSHLGLDCLCEERTSEEGRVSPLSSQKNCQDDNNQSKKSCKITDNALAVAGFIVNEVTECYVNLTDWSSVVEWQKTLSGYKSDHNGNALQKVFSGCVDINYIKALSSFDSGQYSSVRDHLELVPGASLTDLARQLHPTGVLWEEKNTLRQAQKQLIRAATLLQGLAPGDNRVNIVDCLEECEDLCESLVRVEALEWPFYNVPQAAIQLVAASTLKRQITENNDMTVLLPLSEDLRLDMTRHDVGVMSQAGRLCQLQLDLSGYDQRTGLINKLSTLQLAIARLSRKQQNYDFSKKLLLNHMSTLLTNHKDDDDRETVDFNIVKFVLKLRAANGGVAQTDLLQAEREAAKLLHEIGSNKEGLDILSGSVVGYVQADHTAQLKDRAHRKRCGELCAKSLLHMVKWLMVDHKSLQSVSSQLKVEGQGDDGNASPLVQNLKVLLDLEKRGIRRDIGLNVDRETENNDVTIGDNPMLSDTDAIIGRLYHLGTMESPSLAKTWFALAGWCYKWGRKAIDNASHGSVELLSEERSEVLSLLPKGTSSEDTESVLGVLSQIHTLGTSEEDISDQDQSLYDDGAETTRKQLLSSCLSLHVASDETVDRLLNVWRGVVHRVYYYYTLSAKAYFTYLHFNSNTKSPEENNEDGNVIATLRVLRLLVKHAWELREVLEDGLAQTPTAPWKGIIPQLFSRLNHPEGYVRQSVSDLLCRVAQDAPHLIVYPAVVGCSAIASESKIEPDRDGFLNEYLAESDEERIDNEDQTSQEEEREDLDDPSKTILQQCLSAIVDTLSYHNPRMISEVQQLVQELRRITLLWDELWLGTLNQHHQDVVRRMSQLDNEVKKVLNNSTLNKEERTAIIREKHRTIMKPTLYTLEKLLEITSQPAETNHEQWFQNTYGKLIDQAFESLRSPSNPSNPAASWQLFKQLHQSLQQRAQKRNSLILQMSSISPKLKALSGSVIPMPGLSPCGQTVTVASINNTVQILPTKTKPKKILLIGSDGNKSFASSYPQFQWIAGRPLPSFRKYFQIYTDYTDYVGSRHPYLFKGLEDLHLDERIMQFLSIVNNMFASSNRDCKQRYRARHYSVTPLGPRSGLIQWVDGATPLFSLYKRWQQREAIAQALKPTSGSSTASTNPPNIPRPSEVFYNKLTPALKEKGVTSLDSRKDWPISVLRKVLEELMTDTPSDLLARELWCSSMGPNEWFHITQVYAVSTAVMSMIGFIIGLGDRHLDNVLVDLATGEDDEVDHGNHQQHPDIPSSTCTDELDLSNTNEDLTAFTTDLASQEVVHIDYNVCFEKGKGLRVPEKVPFRMTQNLEAAFGVTGVEGTFRVACEHVIKTMRKGRETLLTLLEAFVYDPLVDWTTGNEGGYAGAFYGGGTVATMAGELKQTKKEMEMEITKSMFSIRIAEMKSAWFQNSEDMSLCLPKLEKSIQSWLLGAEEHLLSLASKDSLVEQKMLLEEAVGDSTHSLYSLSTRYEEFSIVKATRDSVHESLHEKMSEFSHWHSIHQHVIESVQGAVFQKMYADMAKSFNVGPPSFSTASDFLQGAGQGQIVSQCEQVETELTSGLLQRRSILRTALDILHTYTTITSQFGVRFVEDNRSFKFNEWFQQLICDFTSLKCGEIVSAFDVKYGAGSMNPPGTPAVLNTEVKLQTIITEANNKLVKLMERRHQDLSETTGLEIKVQNTLDSVHAYLKENDMNGTYSMLGVMLTALGTLNKRYLIMEGAATAAGDRLMDLTSRDGDWFLDELCSMSGNINQFLSILRDIPVPGALDRSYYLLTAFTATHNIYIALQEMNMNFRTIIVPEALKTIHAEESSVLDSLAGLEAVIGEAGQPLDSLLPQLENLHRNTIMGIASEENEAVECVSRMRGLLNQLLQGPDEENTELSPGQMLLMGFNGLFARLDQEFSDMLENLETAALPDIWRKVDVVRDAKALQISAFTTDTKLIQSDIFFVKQLLVMHEFLDMCQQFANTLQGGYGGVCYDDEQMAKPIKKFIAEYVRNKVLGFPSLILGYIICVYINYLELDVSAEIELKDIGAESKVALDDLCKKAVDGCLKTGQFQHHHLTQASSVTGDYDNAWRKHDLARRLDANMALVKSSIQKSQLQLARYQWLHEDVFTQAGRLHQQMVMPNRSTVMSEMRKSVQGLLSGDGTISSCQERYSQLEASITQRLKWAAGANPSLNTVLQQFDEAAAYRQQIIEEDNKLSVEVVNLCQGILHFEAMRTRTPEALSADNTFVQLMSRCSESCVLVENTASTVTDIEEILMATKCPAEGQAIDEKWIKQTIDLIKKEMKLISTKIGQVKSQMETAKEGVKKEVTNIRTILSVHHKLMSEIRSILKSLAKYEEQQEEDVCDSEILGIRDYLNTYKDFSENFTTALKLAMTEDVSKDGMEEAASIISALQSQIDKIYIDLVEFAPPLMFDEADTEGPSSKTGDFASAVKKPLDKDGAVSLQKRPSHVHKELLTSLATPTSSPQSTGKPHGVSGVKKSEKVSRDPRTGKAIQERNSYAVSVWRRVKMKLDGRDPDSNKRLSVAEQVDYVIKEATNLDNLSVLYEGWTPWV